MDDVRLHEDYFDLQLRVATALARLGRTSRSSAIEQFTNLRRRLGLIADSDTAKWRDFLRGLPEEASFEELLACVMETYMSRQVSLPSAFGCFSYEACRRSQSLRIHFMPEASHRRDSPLSDARLSERRSELKGLIADARRRFPHVRRVSGQSWLYNVHSYRRLFPPEYIASVSLPAYPVRMNGSSTWGQVLDFQDKVKGSVRDHVLAHLDLASVSEPWRAFPLQPLSASCLIDAFDDPEAFTSA